VNARQESRASERINVPDYSRVPVGFADLDLGTVDSLGGFTSVPTRMFGLNVARLAARASLFDRRPGDWPRSYVFRYRITNDVGEELVSGTQNVTLRHSAEPVVVRPSRSDLFVGGYTFEVTLVEDKSRWRVERSFEVEESGPPRGKEFEQMLEALSYIAEAREIDQLRSLAVQDQSRGWEEFWHKRDPTPETPRNEAMLEFLRRVRHTERHFQGFGPGWRSDMGRIYIKFGPPDQIEARPASTESPPLELWFYNQPYRRFVFADREGFGRYVLVSPALE
jgi:GWxTD domain-containing protein